MGGYTVDYSLDEFTFYEDRGYDRIKGFEPVGQPGAPELPAVYLNYIIPAYTRVESLVVLQTSVQQIAGEYLIYPAQPPHKPGETLPWVPPDTLIYNSNTLFPGYVAHVIGHGEMDGARIVTIEIRPIQYLPASRKLQLMHNIHIEFCFAMENPPELRAQLRGKYEQSVYDAVLKAIIANDYEISAYYQKPQVVEENQVLAPPPHPELFAPAVIIAPAVYHEAFQPYADWLTEQGIRAILISPQTIYLYWGGRDDAEQIRNYMKECCKYGGTYFLFGGDDYTVPVRYGIPYDVIFPYEPGESDSIPCDLYFSDLTGKWNSDNDDYWGELTHDDADCFSEVFVGRITPYTVKEVENWLTNINKYFFVYAICCHSGAYDQHAQTDEDASDTCAADAFVDAYLYNYQGIEGPFGACAGVFNTRSPLSAWNKIQEYYYDALFRHPEEQIDTTYSYLGVAQTIAKAMYAPYWNTSGGYRHGAYCPNLFASPVTEAWTKTPGNMLVTHPTIIPTGVQTDFTVTAKTTALPPAPLPYAKVCLYKPDDICEVGSTDANGQITFSITPQFSGPMKVTVTRFHNIESDYDQYRPSQTLCEVMPAEEGGGQSASSNTVVPEHLCITLMPTLVKDEAKIKYGVPEKDDVVGLTVYNVLGAQVRALRNEQLVPGYYEDRFDVGDLPGGVYFVVLKQNDMNISKKFLIMK